MKKLYQKNSDWINSVCALLMIFIISLVTPDSPIDKWKVFNPKTVMDLILGLSGVQFISQVLVRKIGNREGIWVSGFLSGLVSSTATALRLSRRTKKLNKEDTINKSVVFLSSTLAMLIEAVVFIAIWQRPQELKIYLILIGPIISTIALMFFWAKRSTHVKEDLNHKYNIGLKSSIELAAFITVVTAVSKIIEKNYGSSGIIGITSLVSLFEVHGSVISNVQLFSQKAIKLNLLGSLVSVSIAASYLSKILIIGLTGSPLMKKITIIWSVIVLISTALSWALFNALT